MPELTSLLSSAREVEHRKNKFLAALQGVDLSEGESDPQKKWEDLKARVYSGGTTSDSNDIVSLQGVNAQQAGFGIGMGLDYVDMREGEPENPFG